jgi:hypothetical protein
MRNIVLKRILFRVATLAKARRDPYVSVHRFQRCPFVSQGFLRDFENKIGRALPTGYRRILTEVGDGVWGPFYGMSSLALASQPEDLDSSAFNRMRADFKPDCANDEHPKGFIRVVNAGCEHYYGVVLNGPHAGQVWRDSSADGLGLSPVTFCDGKPMLFANHTLMVQ